MADAELSTRGAERGDSSFSEATYRPGLLAPVAGYLATVFAIVVAITLTVVAPMVGHHPAPHAGDWNAIWARLGGGEIPIVFGWALWKVASQRVILGKDTMRIVTWGVRWSIGRSEIADVVLMPSGIKILLRDGCQIRPSTFWSTPGLAVALQLGLFKNVASRHTIREAIMNWRQEAEGIEQRPSDGRRWPCRRHWHVRWDWPLLVALIAGIGVEAVVVTALW